MNFTEAYLAEAAEVLAGLDHAAIERMVAILAETRVRGGRLFILGVGGSAANAAHAVNDFRKIVELEAYAPTDNISELTARTNDEGWASVFRSWLKGSRLNHTDCVLVFSVGGGDLERNVSPNLVAALELAKEVGARIVGVVGRDGGYTARVADACVIIPTVDPEHITPHTEAFQSVILHLLVNASAAEVRRHEVGVSEQVSGSPAVFLDRDGVLNRAIVRGGKPYPPGEWQAVEIIPGMPAALERLGAAGYISIGITNQPDVARGTQSRAVVESINSFILSRLPLRDIFVCYHDDPDDCQCRKPRPGLILQAARMYDLDLSRSWMVGDRWKDVAAGRAAGLRTLFVDYRYSEGFEGAPAEFSVESPDQIADIILRAR